MQEIVASQLTPESFAPFGRILEQPVRKPDLSVVGDQQPEYQLEYWDRVVPYGEALDSPNLGVLRLDGRPTGNLVYTSLEIIPDAAETYFPLGTFDAVVLVASGSLYEPDLATLRAFLIAGQPVQITAGVWHQHPLPIGEGSKFDYGLFTSSGVIVRQPEPPDAPTTWSVTVDGGQVLTVSLPEPVRIGID